MAPLLPSSLPLLPLLPWVFIFFSSRQPPSLFFVLAPFPPPDLAAGAAVQTHIIKPGLAGNVAESQQEDVRSGVPAGERSDPVGSPAQPAPIRRRESQQHRAMDGPGNTAAARKTRTAAADRTRRRPRSRTAPHRIAPHRPAQHRGSSTGSAAAAKVCGLFPVPSRRLGGSGRRRFIYFALPDVFNLAGAGTAHASLLGEGFSGKIQNALNFLYYSVPGAKLQLKSLSEFLLPLTSGLFGLNILTALRSKALALLTASCPVQGAACQAS